MASLFRFFCLGALTLVAIPSSAQRATFDDHQYRSDLPVQIQRMHGEISIDGIVDEPAWEAITPVPWHVYDPAYGAPASQQTEMRVAYDDSYIYFSCRCYDSEPDKVSATTYKRDAWDGNYDQFGLMLDTFNDKENTLMFVVSASGVRIDVAILNDAQGEMPFNIPWNTFWDAEATLTEDGWFAESRIPLSSIRFESQNDIATMGMAMYRFISRSNELHIYPERRKDWGFFSFFKPSVAQEVVFEGVEAEKPTYITPYLLAGTSNSSELNDDETDYLIDKGPTWDVGLDMKVGLTSNLTLDLTANTDFAQVEADDQQVNLTRFSLFFPEQRLFFQERATNFELNFGLINRLFYTRQIGINDDEMVPLLGGAKIVGRIGPWDIGALTMQSGRAHGLPSENFGVVRLRRQVLNDNTYAGAIVTTRLDEDGGENVGLGLDGIFRLRDNDYLTAALVHTFDEEVESGLEATRLRAHLRRESENGFKYSLEYNRAGEDYRPDMGFELREDYSAYQQAVGWGVVGVAGDRFKLMSGLLSSDLYVNNGGSLQTHELTANATVTTWDNFTVLLKLTRWEENLDEEFELSDDVIIPENRYTYSEANLNIQSWQTKRATIVTDIVAGQFFDGNRFTASSTSKWNVSKILELGGTYQYDHVTFDARESFEAHLMRAKLGLTFNRKISVSSFVQYSSDADFALGNFRLRYNPREGNDLYVVFNEALNTDRFAKDPIPPYLDSRALVLKYSYTFVR